MDERICRLVSASLAVALAVSCYPCPKIAFAEEVDYVSQAQAEADNGGDRTPDEHGESSGQLAFNGDNGAAAASRVEQFFDLEGERDERPLYSEASQASTLDADNGISLLATDTLGWLLGNVAGGTSVSVDVGYQTLNANNGTLYWAALNIWNYVYQTYLEMTYANNYLKAIDTNTSNISSKSNFIYPQVVSMRADMLTVKSILMESLGDVSAGSGVTSFSFGGVSWSATQGTISWLLSVIQMNLSGIYDNGEAANTKLANILTALTTTRNFVSYIYEYVESLYDNSEVTNTRLQSIITSNAGILTVQGQVRDYLKIIFERDGYTWSAWTLSDIAERIRLDTSDLVELSETANTVLRNNLGKVSQLLLEVEGISVPDYSGEYSKINSSLALIRGAVRPGSNPYETAYADFTLWDWLYTLHNDMAELNGSAVDLVKILSSFFLVDGKSYTAADFVGFGSEVDLTETNKLLGLIYADLSSIRDKYVLGDAFNSLLNGLIGDLQLSAPAAVGQIQTAMSTAFPFCIPSVVNEVLFGSLVADSAAPVWEFDITGSPLVVDFADFDALAEVSRWTVRLLFIAALLLNTKRFVYGLDEV